MHATLKEVLDYAELSRKFKRPVEIVVFGEADDDFRQWRIYSGVSCPVIHTEDCNILACHNKDGTWELSSDHHKETLTIREIDSFERRIQIIA